MLGLDDYGSDSDTSTPSSPKIAAKADKAVRKPARKAQKAPKKITIALPTLSAPKDAEDVDFDSKDDADERPLKKRKTAGAGASSLWSMLPTPKSTNPLPAPQRVLGGGSGPGLSFRTQPKAQPFSVPDVETDSKDEEYAVGPPPDEPVESTPATLFRPTNVGKGRKNISIEEYSVNQAAPKSALAKPPTSAPAVDFFSLGSATSSSQSTAASSSSSSKPSISSAPALPTFEPPEPTPTDPYPGYYQLPSSAWAAHDADYYGKFMKKWEQEYNAHVRSIEKGAAKGFENLEESSLGEVDAMKEMERAKKEIKEREDKKALTLGAAGAPEAPKMTMNASKMSGIARSRHQLSTLLREAYENREALEERIAQGKRNRKEAGNKYGF